MLKMLSNIHVYEAITYISITKSLLVMHIAIYDKNNKKD